MTCHYPGCRAPNEYPDHIHATDRGDEFVIRDRPEPKFFCVSVYLSDRAYGGPEEGGWWYNCGEPVLEYGVHTRIFKTYQEARELQEHLEKNLLPILNKGRRPVSSVLSNGVYTIQIDEDEYPSPYPKERPHYE